MSASYIAGKVVGFEIPQPLPDSLEKFEDTLFNLLKGRFNFKEMELAAGCRPFYFLTFQTDQTDSAILYCVNMSVRKAYDSVQNGE